MESFKDLKPGDIIKSTLDIPYTVETVGCGGDYVTVACGAVLTRPGPWTCVAKADPLAHYSERPPIGLRPKRISDAQRAEEILDAMLRYSHANKFKDVPEEWFEELSDLHFGLREHTKKSIYRWTPVVDSRPFSMFVPGTNDPLNKGFGNHSPAAQSETSKRHQWGSYGT